VSGSILVTGGAGFIGSHVAEAFRDRGWRVSIVDDLSTGRRRNIPDGCSFHEADIRNRDSLGAVLAAESPEVVSHHAAQTSVRISTKDPVADLAVNVLGTVNLLELSREHRVRFFAFASTGGAIYGDGDTVPTPETSHCAPASPYGVAKLCAEHYIAYAGSAYNLPSLTLRYANVYGPRQDPHGEAGVVAIFSRRMLSGGQPVVNGDGRQTRDYVFVGDVVEANVRGIEKRISGTYNVGTGRETDVVELFDTLAGLTDFRGERKHGPAQPGEQLRSCLDTARLAGAMGWAPGTSLPEGLGKTVDWFRENRDEG
jgi:UDP-glucose 4-epimerase